MRSIGLVLLALSLLFAEPPAPVSAMDALAFAVFVMILAAAAACDLTSWRVPNALSLTMAVAALVFAWPHGGDWASCLASGVLVGVVAVGLYLLGAMGGGDVKLLAATALWVPLPALPRFALALGLIGAVQAAATLAVRGALPSGGAAAHPRGVPYAVSIAAAGLAWAAMEAFG